MPYLDIVTRSFTIAWRYRYLWLIAFFSGEAGGGNFFSGNPGINRNTDLATMPQQVANWITEHAGLLTFLAVAWLVLAIALFFLGAVCEGATVRASAEHDAERPFGLRLAWTMGVRTMWRIVRFRLLIIALGLPLALLFVLWTLGAISALVRQDLSAFLALIAILVLLFVVALVYGTYLFFLDRFGSRAVVLEERMAMASIARAHRLLFKRFGRSLLVWLLALAIAVGVGVAVASLSAVLLLPLGVALAATASSGSPAFWVVLAVTLVILLPVYFVVFGFLGAQSSTYWTLAFRRLDLEYPPPARLPLPQAPAQ
jgi:hypothetical protein